MSTSITPAAGVSAVHQGADRRRAERSAVDISAILRFQDRVQAIQGKVCDLSIGGAGFICLQAVAAHSKCTLQFALPAFSQVPGQTLVAPVIVLNSMQSVGQAHQFRVNLQFFGLEPGARSLIDAFIRKSLHRG